MSDFDLEQLNDAVSSAPVVERLALPEFTPDEGETSPLGATDAPSAPNVTPAPSFNSEGVFLTQWGFMHDIGGGIIQSRTGAPCGIGDLARNEGGQAAGRAMYQLILSQPALARLVLSEESTFMGQLAAIGFHGFAIVQVVKLSVTAGREPPVFERHPEDEELGDE